MLKEVDFQYVIKVLYADRAYDREKLYKLCNQYGIKTKIPPKNNAAEHPKLDYMAERNSAVKLIKSYDEDGIKKWKKEMSYGKRSYIESFFSRLKQTFGFSFRNKSETNREKELLVIALFTIIRTDRNMLLACYSHKHISYRIRTIIRKTINAICSISSLILVWLNLR
uniref:transposase n=1 Tax=Wolbachia endosymbiont (group A) of Scambus nigricans TaxID=2954055 RepID=UPI00223207AF|nr:transposase [Wolbachia endosymbiont (group A) of Scambus nigricans]